MLLLLLLLFFLQISLSQERVSDEVWSKLVCANGMEVVVFVFVAADVVNAVAIVIVVVVIVAIIVILFNFCCYCCCYSCGDCCCCYYCNYSTIKTSFLEQLSIVFEFEFLKK